MRIGILSSHPIQYQAPWFRGLSSVADLQVYFARRQTALDQAAAGYGVPFSWDIDLLGGYEYRFLSNVAHRPTTSRFFGCNTPQIYHEIPRAHFDAFIVCGWQLLAYWQAVRACRREGVPVLVRGDSQLGSPRSMGKRAGKALIYPSLLRQFDGFLSVGQRNQEYLRHYGVAEKRLFSSVHFVDTDYFSRHSALTLNERVQDRLDLGVPTDARVLIFVGRFLPFKRIQDIIDAIPRVSPAVGTIHLLLVGAGPLEASLRKQCAGRSVQATFLGFRNQSELPRLYAAADALVLPSDESETWGLVVNEAMACGIPAIVSDAVGCTPDLIEPGRTGESYSRGSIDELARAIERTLTYTGSLESIARLRHLSGRYSCKEAVSGVLDAVDALTGRSRV